MPTPRNRSTTPAHFLALIVSFLCLSLLSGVLAAGLFIPVVGAAGAGVETVPSVFEDIPDELKIVAPAQESTMLDAKNQTIAKFYSKRRIVVNSQQIAPVMKTAIVAIEDWRFFSHKGVDLQGIVRAIVNNLTKSSGMQGASTITQQYVRNALLEKAYLEGDTEKQNMATEDSPERKLREMKYALSLERRMGKDQILTGYLNIAPFGPTTYGVEAAADHYFSIHANALNLTQAALLAGLVQSPVRYDPLIHPDEAQFRRNTVLARMLELKQISQKEHDEAKAVPVKDLLKPNNSPQGCRGATPSNARFCSYAVNNFLSDKSYGATLGDRKRLLESGGITIHTTLDPDKQKIASDVLEKANPRDKNGPLDASIVSLEPQTGKIRAMAQNSPYGPPTDDNPRATMVNYAADSRFQMGSTAKVFTLMQWFKEDHDAYEPVGRSNRTYMPNEFKCNGQPQSGFEPFTVNDLPGKDGAVTVLDAIGYSINQAVVNMATKVDFCDIFKTEAALGITNPDGSPVTPMPPKIIGANESSPLTMASAFGTISNDGKRCEPVPIDKVSDQSSKIIKDYKPVCTEVVETKAAQQVGTVLGITASQYYPREGIVMPDRRPFAAKTGTTDDNSNTWTIGYTPQLATAAWMGHGDASSRGVSDVTIADTFYAVPYGTTVAQHIWVPFMNGALSGSEVMPIPRVPIGTPPRIVEKPQSARPSRGNRDDARRENQRDQDDTRRENQRDQDDTRRGNQRDQDDSNDYLDSYRLR